MSGLVTVTVNEERGEEKVPAVTILGRLLGACTVEQGEAILANSKIARRIHTRGAVPLKVAVDAMHKNHKNTSNEHNYGMLVVAIKEINGLECYTRKLFLTGQITLSTSETFIGSQHPNELEVMCVDESYITIEEG